MAPDERREALRKLFPKTMPAAGPFVYGFHLPKEILPGWRTRKELPQAAPGRREIRRYLLAGQPEDAVDLLVVECPSAADAREAALDYMGACAAPSFKAGEAAKYDFGEAAWGGPGEPGGLALFVRGNLFVAVRRAVGSPSVEPVARWTDGLLAGRPGEGERHGSTAPELVSLKAGSPVGAGKRALILETRDPLQRTVWHQLFVEGGRLERSATGLEIEFTGAQATVEVFCRNENDHWSRGRLVVKA